MFSLHYPNVKLTEISCFGSLLKNDAKSIEYTENILKINKPHSREEENSSSRDVRKKITKPKD